MPPTVRVRFGCAGFNVELLAEERGSFLARLREFGVVVRQFARGRFEPIGERGGT